MATTLTRPELTPIDHFEAPGLDETPAAQLRAIREQAPAFKEWFRSTGTVDFFAARSLVTLPYPKRFALWRRAACRCPTSG